MHGFVDLADRCAHFTLGSLNEVNERTVDALSTSGATSLVKTLQMIRLQKVILAVGMFSIFDATLQSGLDCDDGFSGAKAILEIEGPVDLRERFNDLLLAVNVLKHGHGRSYDKLVAKAKTLPFRIKLPDESFFYEGDVSEISTLIEVDDAFVQLCGAAISEVSQVIRQNRPTFF